jgi:hypothetical protein
MIDAHDAKAKKRDLIRELDERVFDVFVRAVMIEVLGIDVGDDGNRRRKA